MSYKVTASDIGAVQLNETDTVRSVLQNIAIILSTRQGTCPLYRGFGLSQKFVDKPLPVAMPMMYSEVKEAVEEYEPRAEVVNVTFAADRNAPGRLIPTVEVNIINE
jgi:phage baseplate assembly protein W